MAKQGFYAIFLLMNYQCGFGVNAIPVGEQEENTQLFGRDNPIEELDVKLAQMRQEILRKMDERLQILLQNITDSKGFEQDNEICSSPSFWVNKKAALTNLVVIGSDSNRAGSPKYGCRAPDPDNFNNWIPGSYNLKTESCYCIFNDTELVSDGEDIEVLTNPNPNNAQLSFRSRAFIKTLGVKPVIASKSGEIDIFVMRCKDFDDPDAQLKTWIPARNQPGVGPIFSFKGEMRKCSGREREMEMLYCEKKLLPFI